MAGEHVHTHSMTGRRLRTAFLLTAVILVIELAGGFLSHSLALLSDAGHVFTDIVALGLAWFATAQAERPADARNTYGYHRTGILAALANAVTLVLIVGVIAYEAIQRLQHPEPVTPWLMFVAAAAGIVMNLYIGFSLRGEGGDNLNVRAAMLHVFGDVGASVGVIVGGLVILLTGWLPADPLISIGIALLITKGAVDIMRRSLDVLMEGTPKDVNLAQLVRDMVREPGIEDVHDLHVWALAGGMSCLTAHVQVEDGLVSDRDRLLVQLDCMLKERYRIGHTTIQLECAGCGTAHLYCDMGQAAQPHDHGHGDTADGVDATSQQAGSRPVGR